MQGVAKKFVNQPHQPDYYFAGVFQYEENPETAETDYHLDLLVNDTNKQWKPEDIRVQLVKQYITKEDTNLQMLQKGISPYNAMVGTSF